jgi:hypothetical protein
MGQSRRPDRREAPPPREGNDPVITGAITAGWAVALIVVLVLRGEIPAADRWWIWTCATGLGMGLFGLWYVPHLKRARARRAVARGQRGPAGEARDEHGS